jgi:hypothetical protein
MWRTPTGLDKTPCIHRTLAVHDQARYAAREMVTKTVTIGNIDQFLETVTADLTS